MPLRFVLVFVLIFVCISASFADINTTRVEARAVWVDAASIPASYSGIDKLVQQMSDAGVNMLLPEVFHRGYSIYPSTVAIQEPKYKGMDPLAALTQSAHRRGIEVHAWVHVFRQGYTDDKGPILKAHPDWIAKNKLGEELSTNGGYWICPANPTARDYLASVFSDLVQRYDVDGLHLDYIRFETQQPIPYCYNDICREGFKKEYGKDPLEIDPVSPDQVPWNLWRERQINTFVQRISLGARAIKPDVKISAAVGADPTEARVNLLQNWTNWADNRWVDFLTPMAYSRDDKRFSTLVTSEIAAVNTRTLILPGIGVHLLSSPDPALSQIGIARQLNTLGSVLFSTYYIKDNLRDSLKSGPYSVPAISPVKDSAAAIALLEKTNPESPELAKLRSYINYKPAGYVPPTDPPIFVVDDPLPLPQIEVTRASGPITIDGKASEPAWQNVSAAVLAYTNFGSQAPVKTEAKLLYDDQNLYIVFSAEEPKPESIKAAVTERDGPTFYDDSVELFIDPIGKGLSYYHFSANTLGTQFDQFKMNPSWNGNWKVAVDKTTTGWTVEMAIPFSDLKAKTPTSGDHWRANLTRNRFTSGKVEFIAWSVPYGSFHRPERFGVIAFK